MLRRAAELARSVLPGVPLPALAAVLGAVVLAVAGGPAGAQGGGGDRGGPVTLEVTELTTFVAADGAMQLQLAIEHPSLAGDARQTATAEAQPPTGATGATGGADLQVAVTVYGLLDDEAAVDQPLSQPLNRLAPVDVGDLPSDGPGRYRLEIPVRAGPPFDDRARVLLPNPGVYPVSIELRSAGGPLASTTTYLVRLPPITSEDGQPVASVPVALVLSVAPAEGLTISDVRQLLVDHPTIPMTVVLGEGVENQLRADPALAAGFALALAGRPVLAVPPLDLDPSALAEIDQADLYTGANRAAVDGLRDLGLTVADDLVLAGAPLTVGGAEVLRGVGVEAVLDADGRSAGSGRLGSGAARLQLIGADRELSRLLGGGTDGPHRANRVLARLTLRSLVDDRPVVLGGSALGVDPAPSIAAFLRALSQPGAPQPVLAAGVAGGPAVRAAERPEQDLVPIADLLALARDRLTTYTTFHGGSHSGSQGGFQGGGGQRPDDLHQQILSSLTRERNPADRRRALERLLADLDGELAVIQVPDGQPVTLAARSASIPIVVRNDAAGPRQVLLRFHSDKVAAVEGEKLVTIQPGVSAIDVEVEARSLGISPLEVSVWTPDGAILLAENRLEIRSTAVPGLGLLVSVGAVALLGAWWGLDARRRRAGRSRQAADGHGPGGDLGPGPPPPDAPGTTEMKQGVSSGSV